MSTIMKGARALLATIAPVTGHRAGGIVTMCATAGTVNVPKNTYLIPIQNRQPQVDLLVKVETGPNADKSWTVAVAPGTDVTCVSNIGGARHNLTINTPMMIDPPIVGIASAVVKANWVAGTDPTGQEAINSACLFENIQATLGEYLSKSPTTAFPALVLAWGGSDPADGSSTSTLSQRGRGGTDSRLLQDTFLASLFVSRFDSDALRRSDGLALVERLSALWQDRRSVDEQIFSGPPGTVVQRRSRASGDGEFYKRFHCYQIALSVTRLLQREDTRTYYDFDHALINAISPQLPVIPGQGDLTMVKDAKVDL